MAGCGGSRSNSKVQYRRAKQSISINTTYGDDERIQDMAENAKALAEEKLSDDKLLADQIQKAVDKQEKAETRVREAHAADVREGLADEAEDPSLLEDQLNDPLRKRARVSTDSTASFSRPPAMAAPSALSTATTYQASAAPPPSAKAGSAKIAGQKRGAAKAGSVAGGAPPKSAKGPTKKCLQIVPTVTKEYELYLQHIAEGTLDEAAASKSVTMWGRQKGGLKSQSLTDEADAVERMAQRLTLLIRCYEKLSSFDDDRTVQKANALMVAFKNVDTSISDVWHSNVQDMYHLACSVADAHANHIVSGVVHISKINNADTQLKEHLLYWPRHYHYYYYYYYCYY